MKKSEIMVALDYPSAQKAYQLVEPLKAHGPYLKVGLQLFYASGPAFIEKLLADHFRLFLDVKLHDIPNTVKGAAKSLTQLGVHMFNVHCSGGLKMMQAAVEGRDNGLNSAQKRPKVIGVTQLTSTSEHMLNEEIGIPGSVDKSIAHYAILAQKAGLDGVVCSPWEVPFIKEQCGPDFLTITPGIRPADSSADARANAYTQKDDQVRVSTPLEAQKLGSDYMVIGRAITQAKDPVRAYVTILEELATT